MILIIMSAIEFRNGENKELQHLFRGNVSFQQPSSEYLHIAIQSRFNSFHNVFQTGFHLLQVDYLCTINFWFYNWNIKTSPVFMSSLQSIMHHVCGLKHFVKQKTKILKAHSLRQLLPFIPLGLLYKHFPGKIYTGLILCMFVYR